MRVGSGRWLSRGAAVVGALLLGAACSRSGLDFVVHDDTLGAGGRSGGTTPGSGSAPSTASGGHGGRDAPDSSVPPPDAGAEASTGGAGNADAGGADADAGPRPVGDLIFTRDDGSATRLYTLRSSDLSVKQLDPEPPTTGAPMRPIVYSADGRKLVVMEQARRDLAFSVVTPCRSEPCAAPVQREVLRVTGDALIEQSLDARSPVAPDGSGMVLQLKSGAYYLPFDDAGGSGKKLSENNFGTVHFGLGGRAVVVSYEGKSGVDVIDLRPPGGTAPSTHHVSAPGGGAAGLVYSVSQDGGHFIADARIAFSTADVLAGNLEGKALGVAEANAVATNEWSVVALPSGVRVDRWDGAASFVIPDTANDDVVGCDEHVAILGAPLRAMKLFPGLPASPPTLTVLDATKPLRGPSFLHDCTRGIFNLTTASTSVLLDLDTGNRSTWSGVPTSRFSDDGAIAAAGNVGFYSAYRLGDLTASTPGVFTARKSFFASRPVLAHENPFLVIAAPLLDTMVPGIHRVTLEADGSSSVDRLSAPDTDVNGLVISPDDRYFAYGTAARTIPDVHAPPLRGVYEQTFTTGESRRVAVPSELPVGGTWSWAILPEHRAVVTTGTYQNRPELSLYVANVDTAEFVSQVPVEEPSRFVLGTSQSEHAFAPGDGALAWYQAVGSKPARYAQPLRFSEQAPLLPASVLTFDPSETAYASVGRDQTYGIAPGLGPVYTTRPGQFLVDPDYTRVLYYDTASSSSRVLAEIQGDELAVYVSAFGEKTGKIVLWRIGTSGTRISYIEASAPSVEHVVYSGSGTNGARLSPDERFFVYTTASEDGTSEDTHIYDTLDRVDHLYSYQDIGTSHVDLVHFAAEGSRAVIETNDQRMFSVRADSNEKSVLVAEHLEFPPVVSADLRFVALASQDGGFVERLDGSLEPHRFTTAAYPTLHISDGGRWIVSSDNLGSSWQLYRVDTPEAKPVDLPDSTQSTLLFDPGERFVSDSVTPRARTRGRCGISRTRRRRITSPHRATR